MLSSPMKIKTSLARPQAKLTLWEKGEKIPDFGQEMRKEFPHNFDQVTFVNQGSYGSCPKKVMDYRHALLDEMESYPDEWFRQTIRSKYDDALEKVANFVGADKQNLVFVPNATAGMNTVLKGLALEPETKVLFTSHIYPAIENTVDEVVTGYDADTLCVGLKLPINSEQEIVDFIKEICDRNHSIRVVVLDHISSCSGILFPIEKIVRAIKQEKEDLIVVVDGAHAPGHIALNLEALGEAGVDFYTGNLHKWALAPRGCAILWAKPKYQQGLRPLITSHCYKKSFQDQFYMQGTMDQTTYICSAASLSFLDSIGGLTSVEAYVGPLLDWAQEMLASALGTKKLQVPKSMNAPYFRSVALPKVSHLKISFCTSESMITDLMASHSVVAQIATYNESMWVRLSGSVYSTKDDYLRLKESLMDYLKL